MAWIVGAVMAALVLGGDFGTASATGEPAVGNRVLVNLEVEVGVSAEVVVAHLISPGQDQETISLVSDRQGLFRGAATVPKVDLVVVFEAVRGPGDSSLSSPATLTELGLDPELLGVAPAPIEPSALSPVTGGVGGPLLIAIVSGALSLGLLAWWALSGRRSEEQGAHRVGAIESSQGGESVADSDGSAGS